MQKNARVGGEGEGNVFGASWYRMLKCAGDRVGTVFGKVLECIWMGRC